MAENYIPGFKENSLGTFDEVDLRDTFLEGGTISGLLKADGEGNLSAAVPGLDFVKLGTLADVMMSPNWEPETEYTVGQGVNIFFPFTGEFEPSNIHFQVIAFCKVTHESSANFMLDLANWEMAFYLRDYNSSLGTLRDYTEQNIITDQQSVTASLDALDMAAGDFGDALGDIAQFPVDINRYGFLNQTETTIAFDGTSIFTLGSVGASWSYYRAGLKYTITGNKTIDLTDIDETLVDGALYFIYIDATDGTLAASRTAPWTLNDTKVPVALLLWNDTLTPKFWLADERHSVLIDRREHYRVHFTEGTRPISVGELDGYTVDSDVNANKVFSIAESKIIDEDIILTLGNLAKPNGAATDYTVFYRTDADTWAWKASNMPFVYNVGNTNDWIQWDNAGTMTNATGGSGGNARFVNSYLILTNFSGSARFTFISGQNIYTTLAAARAEAPSSFEWGTFPIAECVIVYRLTWSTITSTSQGQCRLAAVPQAISVSPVKTLVSGGSIDHNTLAGLNAGEYQHLTVAEKGYLPTADEKAALAGTGTPSALNKYVTEDTIGDIETLLAAL